MPDHDHKLMSTPVSVNDGLRRADSRTWKLLAITAVLAILIVSGVNLFLPKPDRITWPDTGQTPATQTRPAEPRTYDVVPRARPQPNQ